MLDALALVLVVSNAIARDRDLAVATAIAYPVVAIAWYVVPPIVTVATWVAALVGGVL